MTHSTADGAPAPRQAPLKGRGATRDVPHRFQAWAREAFDDGWEGASGEGRATPRTEVVWEDARSALTRNDSPDIFFDQAVNPYRGCEHGCVYCYARVAHGYLGLSPGLDFETRLIAKRNIAALLRAELTRPGYRPRLINIGSATDCYQPIERQLRLTRALIELFSELRHPFALITKGSGVERDIDLLAPLARARLVAVQVTITTLDARLARVLEPRAAAPQRRLRTIERLAQAGIPVGVSVAPQIPFLTDDMERVLAAARDAGAGNAFYSVVRLPWELGGLMREWLAQHYPERAARVLARIRELHGVQEGAEGDGAPLYRGDFATRMKGQGPWAELLAQRFAQACARLGLAREHQALDLTQFRPWSVPDQGALF